MFFQLPNLLFEITKEAKHIYYIASTWYMNL